MRGCFSGAYRRQPAGTRHAERQAKRGGRRGVRRQTSSLHGQGEVYEGEALGDGQDTADRLGRGPRSICERRIGSICRPSSSRAGRCRVASAHHRQRRN